jgi:AraC-like DNA-binding protein
MKALPFKIPKTERQSIRVQVDKGAHFYDNLHYHPEWQITVIIKGSGTLYIGSSFTHFHPGTVYMVGSNVAHLMKNTPAYFGDNSPGVEAVSLFFGMESLGKGFFEVPELRTTKYLLQEAARGILFQEPTQQKLYHSILSTLEVQGLDLIYTFIGILQDISQEEQYWFLNEHSLQLPPGEEAGQRLDRVFRYSFAEHSRKIKIEEVAQLVNLSVSQFCRYFKKHTGKTYVQFLNELRVEAACQQLMDRDCTVAEVAYRCGFQNLSNFNRQFRKVKGMAPRTYLQNLANAG